MEYLLAKDICSFFGRYLFANELFAMSLKRGHPCTLYVFPAIAKHTPARKQKQEEKKMMTKTIKNKLPNTNAAHTHTRTGAHTEADAFTSLSQQNNKLNDILTLSNKWLYFCWLLAAMASAGMVMCLRWVVGVCGTLRIYGKAGSTTRQRHDLSKLLHTLTQLVSVVRCILQMSARVCVCECGLCRRAKPTDAIELCVII